MHIRFVNRYLSSSLRAALMCLGSTAVVAGCSTIEPVAPHEQPVTDPTKLYASLTLNHPAVTMSTVPPYDTLQLVATPRNALGNPMSGLPVPTFESPDTTKLRVTSEGLVTAVGTTGEGLIIVRLGIEVASGRVTHADTALIRVTNLASPPVLDTVAIRPLPPDSAVWAIDLGGQKGLTYGYFSHIGLVRNPRVLPRAVTSTGVAITNLLYDYVSLDPKVATVHARNGSVTLVRPGQVRMAVRSTAYGVARADTVVFTITMPIRHDVYIVSGSGGTLEFVPVQIDYPYGEGPLREVRIAPYGIVAWSTKLGSSLDVVFDDPATPMVQPPASFCNGLASFYGPAAGSGGYCGTGDMVVPANPFFGFGGILEIIGTFNTMRFRQFTEPGVYPFHSVQSGATGRVIVTTGFTD